jgi:V8-like Glu-specific endopeptidase
MSIRQFCCCQRSVPTTRASASTRTRSPWRAVRKLQAASLNLRELCTATLVGPSTVMTAARCTLNHRTQRYFPPESLHFLIGYDGHRYAGYAMRICPGLGDGVVGLRRSV